MKFHKKARMCYSFIYMQTKIAEKYFFFGLLLTTFIFTFFVFRPFWEVLVLGISFSVVLHPLYKWLCGKKIPESIASLITLFLFTMILCGPLLGIGTLVFKQSETAFNQFTSNKNTEPFLTSIDTAVNNVLPEGINFSIRDKTSEFVTYLSKNVADIFTTTLSAFFSFILLLLIIFYFLKDGMKWRKYIIILSPLSDKDDEKIIDRLTFSINGIIKGTLLISLIQGILMGVGLFIFGVPNPALWGMVAMFTSLLPTIGTAFVSIPAIIFLFATGNMVGAIGLTAWSTIIVGLIDNLLNPFIVGKTINIPPLLILFSVLGGISFLGPIGILVGPLAVSLLYTLISIYRNEFKQNPIL